MENTQQNQEKPQGATQTPPASGTKPTPNPVVQETNKTYKVVIQCAIRRKLSLVGLPGADPNERIYKLGSALDIKTNKNLKGVEGALEKKLMPTVIGKNSTEPDFHKEVNEYWGNIGVLIPADETHLREDEKGKVIKFEVNVKGTVAKNLIEGEPDIEKKFRIIAKGLEDETMYIVREASVPDFLLLAFALRNREVAKDITLAGNSPRIKYYLYNKNTAVKQRLNIIELRARATDLFSEIKEDDNKINALLVMFGKLPTDYDDMIDKYIALDEEYTKSPETMQRFINYATDADLDLKYLVKLATKKGKLTNPTNTDAYYYNQILLGANLDEAVLYLKSDENEAKNIKNTLEREIKD